MITCNIALYCVHIVATEIQVLAVVPAFAALLPPPQRTARSAYPRALGVGFQSARWPPRPSLRWGDGRYIESSPDCKQEKGEGSNLNTLR